MTLEKLKELGVRAAQQFWQNQSSPGTRLFGQTPAVFQAAFNTEWQKLSAGNPS